MFKKGYTETYLFTFIALQSFQRDMYDITHFQILQKRNKKKVVKEKGSKVYNGNLKVKWCISH